jgi:predicted ATPase
VTERITSIRATAFRGVPGTLTVELPHARSLIVFGDNGTGKSTIADALEWYFTGHVEFLRHEGRQQALRHLAAPGGTTTTVEIGTTGSLGGQITYPDGVPRPEASDAASRDTFLLRGRTLVQFVEKPKAEKWKALAQILGLDAVDKLRLNLQRAKNELQRDFESASDTLRTHSVSLAARIPEVNEGRILDALTEKCAEAGVAVPATLDEALDPSWARSVTGPDEAVSRAVELTTLASELRSSAGFALDRVATERWNAAVAASDPAARGRLTLFKAADAYVGTIPSEGACPLCGQTVSDDTLSARIKQILHVLSESVSELEQAESSLSAVAESLEDAQQRIGAWKRKAGQLGVELLSPPTGPKEIVRRALQERDEVDISELTILAEALSDWVDTAAGIVEENRPAPGSPTRSALIEAGALAADARSWRTARNAHAAAERAAQLADQVFTAYQSRQREYVEHVLERISDRVADIYERLHPGEGLGSVKVEPWSDKGIELAVDFHGIRQKPPHGVLSESHLNSLAIALFLAMAETFNERMNFLVLDDIVNSFDMDHRGNLAKLLVDEFDSWQLIVLTHDHQFHEYIRRRANGWTNLEFTSWSYESGPRTTRYETGGMLEKAERCLPDDATGAAQKGRRALEELLQEICEALQAPLPFRRGAKNDQREPGELFTGLRRGLKEAARPLLAELEPLLRDLEADVGAALHVESHASRGRASPEEVRAALERIHDLDVIWSCPDCETRVWYQGTPASSRCKCGHRHFPPPTAATS